MIGSLRGRLLHRGAGEVLVEVGGVGYVVVVSPTTAVSLGEVGDENTRADVEAIARSVPNVAGVVNDVQVAGVSSTTSRSNDTLITSSVKTRLADNDKVNMFHVKVVTEAAVVYLLGVVTEQEAAAAVEIARTTSGVRKVVKVFEYCKPTDEVCQPRK